MDRIKELQEDINKQIKINKDLDDKITKIKEQISSIDKDIIILKRKTWIIINGKRFNLLYIFKDSRDREHVVLEYDKGTSQNQLIFYRSKSEGGILRLCTSLVGTYYKGADYVTSSFVHIQLQDFIFKNLTKLKSIKQDECGMDTDIIKLLGDKSRIVDDPIIQPLQKCPTAECFSKGYKKIKWHAIKNNIQEFINNLTDTDVYTNNLRDKLIEKNKKYTDPNLIITDPLYRNKLITDIVDSISSYMKEYFEIVGSKQFITQFNFEYDGQIIIYNIHKIKIKNKINGNEYSLLYGCYSYKGKSYKIVVNMIPIDSKINEYGIYDKIVSAGIYIYKSFEYTDQCSVYEPWRCFGKNYQFIGDFLDKMWPLPDKKC